MTRKPVRRRKGYKYWYEFWVGTSQKTETTRANDEEQGKRHVTARMNVKLRRNAMIPKDMTLRDSDDPRTFAKLNKTPRPTPITAADIPWSSPS